VNVELKPLGCLGVVGAIFSFGLLPMVVRAQEKRYPATLTEDGLTLRNGKFIPWSAFVRARATSFHVEGMHVNRTYELWHAHGRVHFPSRRIMNIDAVSHYIAAHLPRGADISEWSAGVSPLSKAINKARQR
jgi:hypothetical protein